MNAASNVMLNAMNKLVDVDRFLSRTQEDRERKVVPCTPRNVMIVIAFSAALSFVSIGSLVMVFKLLV